MQPYTIEINKLNLKTFMVMFYDNNLSVITYYKIWLKSCGYVRPTPDVSFCIHFSKLVAEATYESFHVHDHPRCEDRCRSSQ